MTSSCTSLICCCLVLLSHTTFSQKSPIVTSDLLKMQTASQLDLSPDGSQAVFVVTSIVEDETRDYAYQHHLWLADIRQDTTYTRQLTFGDRQDSQPVWSPDGSRIAFVRQEQDQSQIWILPFSGGEAYLLTHAPHGAAQPTWSPDGQKLLYTSGLPFYAIDTVPAWQYERPGRDPGDEPNYLAGKDTTVQARPDGNLKEVRAWLAKNASKDNPTVISRLDFLGEKGLDNEMRFSHLFVTHLQDTTQVRQLTQGFQNHQSPSWSPDGKWIVYSLQSDSLHPDRNLRSELWKVGADGSQPQRVLSMPDKRLYQPQYAPDGKHIAFVASDLQEITYAQSDAAVVRADGSNVRILTEDFDRSLNSVRWAEDSKSLFFTAPDQGYFPLFQVPVRGGEVAQVLQDSLGIYDYDLADDRLVLAATQIQHPFELYTATTDGTALRQITQLNSAWISQKLISEPRAHRVTHEGRTIDYWVMPPIGLQEGMEYPVVLEMHGGPSAMWGPGELSMWHEFQLLNSWGYGVVYANPRGSGGYGHDFRRANYQNWGKGPASDVLAALEDALRQHDWMDSSQLFLTGGSYAGYLTAWIVSQDHRFEAAVAQRGVYDLAFFFGEGNAWRLVPDHFGGYPWEPQAKQAMDANSPQTFVADIRTPLLIMHSSQDLRTGVRQSELLYKSLKVLNKPVEYIRYPEEGHELSRSGNPLRRMDRLNRIVEFFERYADHPVAPPATQQAAVDQDNAGE